MLQWSDQQHAYFDDVRNGTGHTCVEALAGSGKSTSIIEGLKHLPKNTGPFLLSSFSVKSVEALRAKRPPYNVDVRTLNSLGHQAVVGKLGLQSVTSDNVFNILDDLLGEAPKSRDLARTFNGFRVSINKLVALAKSQLAVEDEEFDAICDEFMLDPAAPMWMRDMLRSKFDCGENNELFGVTRAVLEGCKDPGGFIDYNDQLWLPVVLDFKLPKFGRIFIDEAQDLAPVQMELLIRSMKKDSRLTMVGDDFQAIYAWRGAGMGMEPFANRLTAKRMPLSVSYRCPKAVIERAKVFVPHIEAAPGAIDGIVEAISVERFLTKAKTGDVVLSRSNAPLIKLRNWFIRHQIPVVMVGSDITGGLKAFVAKSGARSTQDLLDYTDNWERKEVERRRKRDPDAKVDAIVDKADCIRALADGTIDIGKVYDAIEGLLNDPDGPKVTLSTVHRAKGLEWDRVWMLDSTFKTSESYWMERANKEFGNAREWAREQMNKVRANDIEERNIAYVATTRAKQELYMVQGKIEIAGR